ncbi:imm11 family protein [Paenibacillus sp. FSL R7-0179]|uniref:imm11 family protein n=1 Tax=Paenibacillus sp. FSL R7-0179 TaxID=2921672 RepID=UPI0030F9C25D
MKIYEFKVDYSITTTLIMNDEDEKQASHSINNDFEGQKLAYSWQPIELITHKEKLFNDFPHFINGKPIISVRVMQILKPFIAHEVEFLPLLHDELNIFMINVINVLDCVDWQKSKVKWFKEKYFLGFDKLVFDFAKVPEKTFIFKIKEKAAAKVYVTELFKELIEEYQLPGLDFSVVYDSEFTEEVEQLQQREYEAALQAIENNKGTEFSYAEAEQRLNQGKAVESGKWKMQYDEKGELWLGELMLDLKYEWGRPVYIPPILLGYLWHEVDYTQIKSKHSEE